MDIYSAGTAVFTNILAVVLIVTGIITRSFTYIHWIVLVVSHPATLCLRLQILCLHCIIRMITNYLCQLIKLCSTVLLIFYYQGLLI